MNKRIVSNGIIVLLIFSIPTLLYLLNFKSILFDTSFYAAEFEKHEVYERFEGADEINERLLNYFRNEKGGLVAIDIYDNEEKQHLFDVKRVINNAFRFFNFILAIFLILLILLFLLNKKSMINSIIKTLMGGGIFTICFSVVILLFSVINFDSSFNLFHKIFFEKGTWLFPEGSSLIAMYPAGFFYDFAKQLFTNVMIHGFILVLVGFFILILWTERKTMSKMDKLNVRLGKLKKKTI